MTEFDPDNPRVGALVTARGVYSRNVYVGTLRTGDFADPKAPFQVMPLGSGSQVSVDTKSLRYLEDTSTKDPAEPRTNFPGGGMRDGAPKTERFDLLWTQGQTYDQQMLVRAARWMAKGAQKYPHYKECDCGANTVTERFTPGTNVGVVTNESYEKETQGLPNDSGRTTSGGSDRKETWNANGGLTENALSLLESAGFTTGSPRKSSTGSSSRVAESVAGESYTSTTTTPVAPWEKVAETVSGQDFATGVTSASGSTRAGSRSTSGQHWSTCASHQLKNGGGRNWESFSSGEALEHAKASLLRHTFKMLNGDTDEDHAAAVWFNTQCIEYIRERLIEENQ